MSYVHNLIPSKADELAHRFGMSKFGGGIQPYVYTAASERHEELGQEEQERSAPVTSEVAAQQAAMQRESAGQS